MTWQPVSYAKKTFASAKLFFNEHRHLIVSLTVIALLFFLLWRFASNSWSAFGLNAFTEIVGIILTVFLVDQIVKGQERRRMRPLEIAAFRDIQRFVDGLATLWLNIYKWSGKGELPLPAEPPSMQEFLTLPYFEQIRRRLNLNAEACVFPIRTWWQSLPQAEDQFRKLGEKILERHTAVLDPQAYHLVHKVLNGFLDSNIGLSMLPVLREAGGLGSQEDWDKLPEQYSQRLGRYWIVIEDNLKDFADLHEWYRKNKRLYLGHD